MALITLKHGADVEEVKRQLKADGITVYKQNAKGQLIVFVNRKQYLARFYPEALPVYEADRKYWREVRKRTKNGEHVSKEELKAHAEWYRNEMKKFGL